MVIFPKLLLSWKILHISLLLLLSSVDLAGGNLHFPYLGVIDGAHADRVDEGELLTVLVHDLEGARPIPSCDGLGILP